MGNDEESRIGVESFNRVSEFLAGINIGEGVLAGKKLWKRENIAHQM